MKRVSVLTSGGDATGRKGGGSGGHRQGLGYVRHSERLRWTYLGRLYAVLL